MFHTNKSVTLPAVTTAVTREKMLLPVVRRMVARLDQLFTEFVGPVAPELVGEVFDHWLVSGKTGPSGLLRYIEGLAQLLDNPADKARFTSQARVILARL
ncbi:hypothetical protein [Cellvibrio sp. pealriver]|uniref:hypothetical protein n=1 Tax=Cellvibrio sp. pealriver TaxID=1622269 RepID=UPI00066FC6E2|nr:hypothetical protein [Cellvibrio sp. pealriver]